MSHCPDRLTPAPQDTGGPQPDWYDPARVVMDLDVAALLATGEHPLARVQAAVARCAPGEIVQLRSTFKPTPLLAAFTTEGLRVWCGHEGDLFRTCICKS